jgi:hypothetical protein
LPICAADLIRYQLLILRMYTQFDGLAWYNYDEAFRRDAAARHVVDWSRMHVELYNFHTLPVSLSYHVRTCLVRYYIFFASIVYLVKALFVVQGTAC